MLFVQRGMVLNHYNSTGFDFSVCRYFFNSLYSGNSFYAFFSRETQFHSIYILYQYLIGVSGCIVYAIVSTNSMMLSFYNLKSFSSDKYCRLVYSGP